MGIKVARGVFIALLDSDDVWLSTKLERQIQLFKGRPDVALVYCMVEHMDENGTAMENVGELLLQNPSFKDLMHTNWILGSGSSVLIRRSAFDKVGYFDEDMKSVEDLNMWLRILHEYDSARVDEVLVRIRRHRGSMQTDITTMERNLLNHVEKAVQMFPELRPFSLEARFMVYKGLLYLGYVNNRKKDMLRYYVKAVSMRPSFFFEAASVFIRKYFFRRKKFY